MSATGFFQHILVPTDFGEASERALDLALALATKLGSQVTLVHSMWLPPSYYSSYAEGVAWPTDELEGHAKKELDAALLRARARYARVESALVGGGGGESWERILATAKDCGADLIVMGTHGRRGLSHLLLGSVAEKVVRLSPIPVMTVCPKAAQRAKEQVMHEQQHAQEQQPQHHTAH